MSEAEVKENTVTEVIDEAVTEEAQAETNRFSRARHIGRQVLASVAGFGVAAGFTYTGLRIGVDVVGPANDSSDAMRYAGVAMPTVLLGGIGAVGALYTAAALSD